MPVSFSWSLGGGDESLSSTSAASVDTAIRDLALDANDDTYLLNGDLVFVSGVEGIASDLRSRLQTFAGECFLDTSLGVPWLEKVLGHKPTPGELQAIFRSVILETPGVLSVQRLDVSTTARVLSVSFRATTATGATLEAALGINLGGA
jgi:hypothetical protein